MTGRVRDVGEIGGRVDQHRRTTFAEAKNDQYWRPRMEYARTCPLRPPTTMIGVSCVGKFGSCTIAAVDCVGGETSAYRATPFGQMPVKLPDWVPKKTVPSVQMFGDAATKPDTGAMFFRVPSSWNCVSCALLGTKSVPSAPRSGEPVIALCTWIGSRSCAGSPSQ